MPQKFFTRSIESDFIKQLLRKEPVPIMDSAVKGRTIYKGYSYVYDGNIIECTKTGVLGGSAEYSVTVPVVDSKFCFGNFTSRTTYYDGETHYQLGNYLRYYRDRTGVDLMPFYNCFNYTFITDLYLSKVDETTAPYGYVKGKNSNYKVVAVPIKMGMEYTIFIDCPYEVLVKPLFYNEFGLVEINAGSYISDKVTMGGKFVLSYPQMSFSKPIKIKIDLTTNYSNGIEPFYAFQRYLYLAIQLPASNNSSIVVLEGDYTGRCFKYFGADAYSDVEARSEILDRQNYLMLRQPSLAFCNTGTTFAFSDRLIEYLLWNVITSEEPLDGNISFVQRNIDGNRLKGYFDGVWSPNIRASLWYKYKESLGKFEKDVGDGEAVSSTFFSNSNEMLDMNGYVDKDMEKILTKG